MLRGVFCHGLSHFSLTWSEALLCSDFRKTLNAASQPCWAFALLQLYIAFISFNIDTSLPKTPIRYFQLRHMVTFLTELPDIKAAFPSHPTQFVGWHRMTCQIIHFTRPATLKNSSLLTHISQWQYKVGFTTWTTPCGLPLLTVYKPYDLFSYDTRAATGWNSCTGHYKREHSIIYISCNFDTRLMEEKDQDFDSCMQAPLIFNVRISYTFHRCNCNYKAVVSQWYLQ